MASYNVFGAENSLTYLNQVAWDSKGVRTEFVIAIVVFPVELLACQVSMVGTANWPR